MRVAYRYRHIAVWGVLIAGLVLSACGGGAQVNSREHLPMAIDNFHSHLLWGRYSDAALYLPDGEQGAFLGAYDEIGDDLHYTEYEVDSNDVNQITQVATVVVTLSWYQVPSYTIEETRIREIWTWDEEAEVWWLTQRTDADTEIENNADPEANTDPEIDTEIDTDPEIDSDLEIDPEIDSDLEIDGEIDDDGAGVPH